MTRRHLAWLGLVLAVEACQGPAVPQAPDPLDATAAAVSAAGAAITAQGHALEDDLRADLRARRLTCPGGQDRPICLALAREQALARIADRAARLREATALQRAAAAALEEADRCRRAGAGDCAGHQQAALAAAAELAPLVSALTGAHP